MEIIRRAMLGLNKRAKRSACNLTDTARRCLFLDICVQIAKQTFSTQHVVINCKLRILLLEIFLDAHQLDFIPRTLLRIVAQMDKRYFK